MIAVRTIPADARLAQLLELARQLGPDELGLLLQVAAEILKRRQTCGELHVENDPRQYRPESIEAMVAALVEHAERLLAQVRLAGAVLVAFARRGEA